MPSKDIPRRSSRSAESYARKVRMEPPKATRQEDPLVDRRARPAKRRKKTNVIPKRKT